jgi:hypothetical protein
MCQLASFVVSKSSTQRTKVHNPPDILEEINKTLKINRLARSKIMVLHSLPEYRRKSSRGNGEYNFHL